MSGFPGSPRLLKGGIVLLDRDSGAVERIIALQYNPETLTRSLQSQASGGEGGDRLEALRIKGPPVEAIRLEAELDATDQLEAANENPDALEFGIHPQLATLETILYPRSERLVDNDQLAASGTLEIVPPSAPLTIFVWSKNRVLPVRITEFSVIEEAFDTNLNPTRAKVSLGMRVLSINDLVFDSTGGSLYMIYQQQKEMLAGKAGDGSFDIFGIEGI